VRFLYCTPYPVLAENSGAARRVLGIARALAGAGHEVRLLSPPDRDEVPAPQGTLTHRHYRVSHRGAYFANRALARVLRQQRDWQADLLIAAFPYQVLMLRRHCAATGTPLVYDAHNLEAVRFRELGGLLTPTLVRWAERGMIDAARAVLAVSEADRAAFRSYHGTESLLLENGVDTQRFTPAAADAPPPAGIDPRRRQRTALFFGAFDYAPNREALRDLLRLDWPLRTPGLPPTQLLVIGRRAPSWAHGHHGVRVLGAVERIEPYVSAANIVLAPLSSGGGTRLKIIEALACAQVVLATHFGAEGLAADERAGLYRCSREQFGKALRALLRQPLAPGANAAGRHWALGRDWRQLVATIDWGALARVEVRP
jgi:glycosyltransferase involved in cell wall biosynthesis